MMKKARKKAKKKKVTKKKAKKKKITKMGGYPGPRKS